MKGSYLNSYTIREIAKINVGRDLVEKSFSKEPTSTHTYPVYSNTVENKGLYGFYDFEEYPANSLTVVGRGAGLGTAFPRNRGFGAIGRLLVLSPKNHHFDVRYLSEYINNKLIIYNESGGIPQLPGESFAKYEIELPPLPEQKAIADLLSTWDEAIEKTERLIQAKETRFKWLLREFISEPQNTQNTQKDTEWKKVKLGDVCKIASNEKLRSVNGHFLLTVKLHCLGIERNDRITPKLTERGRPYFQHKSGDFLIGRQNFHNGGFGIIPPELDGGITSNAISCLIVNKSKLSKDFLWFQFANPNYYKKVGYVMDGTGQKELSDKQILKLEIWLPELETQNQIAETLSSAQHEIELLKQLAEKYKTQKRGLMQKMLTGEWRVKPDVVKQYE